jgi:hypothetical protein
MVVTTVSTVMPDSATGGSAANASDRSHARALVAVLVCRRLVLPARQVALI